MMSLSEDTYNGELALNGGQVEPRPQPEENHNTREQADITPANKAANEHQAPPAWLERQTSQGSFKVKLPPVTAPGNKKKKKHHRNPRQNSKGKLNAAIEPVQEEMMRENVNA